VRAAEHPGALLGAIDELAELAGAADAETLAALRDRLLAARLRVLVVGEAKRGKSTLVNALLGAEVLPAGVTPLTALATTVSHGAGAHAEVTFHDGRAETFPLDALHDLVTERNNPGNSRSVASVTVRLDVPILARGVEIVDTPGVGSVYAHNTAAADSALPTMDAAVFVLTADPPVSATERELLGRVAGLSVTMFVVLNKADYLDPAGLAEAVAFTAGVVREAAGQDLSVYPLSARAALTPGGDVGFARFAADFGAYLDAGRGRDLRRSAVGQLRRVGSALLDEVTLAQRAAQMRSSEAAARVQEFTARLDAVAVGGRDAADVAAAESRRLLAALNEAAEAQTARLISEFLEQVDAKLAGELAAASAAEIERRGREWLRDLLADAAENWRQDQRERCERGLGELEERLTAALAAELDALRGAAADLLGLELSVPGAAGRLRPDRRFFFDLAERVDQAELLAGAVRRRMPGEFGRRLAREHVRGEIADLVGSQVGRARADLQYRLAEATRRLVRDVQDRYAASTDRLTAALQTAAALRAETLGAAEGRLAELAAREQALRGVLGRLESDPCTT
jgi:GTP-binding protein EngB required for normal cell division